MSPIIYPRDFIAAGWNIGIKDDTLDFGVIHSLRPATIGAVFTRNNFPGNPIIVGRKHVSNGVIRTIVVNSKNANVATGKPGLEDSLEICRLTAGALNISPEDVLPSSTGVIGYPLPMERIRQACKSIPEHLNPDGFESFSRAIMTTDIKPKMFSGQTESGIRITGIAKGAGMIEPNMATMLAYVITDAKISAEDLRQLTRITADRTFNRISVDSDTSTSDTFATIANGASNEELHFPAESMEQLTNLRDPFAPGVLKNLSNLSDNAIEFLELYLRICRDLAREIVRDGEGAKHIIEVRIDHARDRNQAVKIGRSIINSPLVKTAIYGADPNWGRLVMAIGKVFDEPVDPDKLRIHFGEYELLDSNSSNLKSISEYLKQEEVILKINLGMGEASEILWGCDLTEEYIKINAYYTT